VRGIKPLLFYVLSKLSGNLEEDLMELKRLTDEGCDFRYVSQEFSDYITDLTMRKSVISGFLWFAELYREI